MNMAIKISSRVKPFRLIELVFISGFIPIGSKRLSPKLFCKHSQVTFMPYGVILKMNVEHRTSNVQHRIKKQTSNTDELVKSRKTPFFVIPAKAGIQFFQLVAEFLDSGFHRSDDFLRNHQYWTLNNYLYFFSAGLILVAKILINSSVFSFSIQNSMLDVRCSMFIFFSRSWGKTGTV